VKQLENSGIATHA